ncbi:MAG: sulfotransferase [Hyphomonas sp.]|nr:sulfotransferase [Hyphomonas sp.]
MHAALALAGLAICIEILLRLPFGAALTRLVGAVDRASRLIRNPKVSDHWKERALPACSLRMITASLALFAILAAALLPFGLMIGVSELFWSQGAATAAFLMSVPGIALLTVAGAVYAWVRTRPARRKGVAANDADAGADKYTGMDRFLHRLFLSSPSRGEMLFDIESASAKADPDAAAAGEHVYVCGLARAGTTILMRALHENGDFASLTYNDMPMVMAPNLWARLRGRAVRNTEAQERAHSDGILVDVDSPEALEEPFWRTFAEKDYILPDRLQPHEADAETIGRYRRFVAHILARYGRTRYLAKNNNAILRLGSLRDAFPAATFLVPFRDPVSQAHSLKAQHEKFNASRDGFARQYMDWLAHHEFGPGHRPFSMDGALPRATPADINYWLSMWVDVYGHLAGEIEQAADSPQANILPVAYEDLCSTSTGVWTRLSARLGIAPGTSPFQAAPALASTDTINADLLSSARAIYGRLQALQLRLLDAKPSRLIAVTA